MRPVSDPGYSPIPVQQVPEIEDVHCETQRIHVFPSFYHKILGKVKVQSFVEGQE